MFIKIGGSVWPPKVTYNDIKTIIQVQVVTYDPNFGFNMKLSNLQCLSRSVFSKLCRYFSRLLLIAQREKVASTPASYKFSRPRSLIGVHNHLILNNILHRTKGSSTIWHLIQMPQDPLRHLLGSNISVMEGTDQGRGKQPILRDVRS